MLKKWKGGAHWAPHQRSVETVIWQRPNGRSAELDHEVITTRPFRRVVVRP
jgi:hypothetical protein